MQIDARPVLQGVVDALRAGASRAGIAAAFHTAVARVSGEVCVALRRTHGLREVALSGGVFQNARLLRATTSVLDAEGFVVMAHRRVPPNDGGLALGQAAIATLGGALEQAR
jgi:hydrogenase maturation protein HypF